MLNFKTLLALVFAFSSLSAQARLWDLSEASILFPLSEQMIPPGELLPAAIYRKHPIGFLNDYGEEPTYTQLRAVGLRVDPIEHQIRIVWQPVFRDRTIQAWSTEDKAGHTFYQLNTKEFSAFLTEWTALLDQVRPAARLSARRSANTFGIHPAFSDPKLAPLFLSGITKLLQKYCGSRNLIQYTSMRLMSPDHTWWSFSGIELDRAASRPGQWRELAIPRIKDGKTVGHYSENKVDFFNMAGDEATDTRETMAMRGQFNFGYDDDTDLRPVFSIYSRPTESDRPLFLRTLPHVARFQNPAHFDAKTLDCASCHAAQPVQNWMMSSMRGLKLPRNQSDLWFKNPDPKRFDLRNDSIAARSTRVVRAFGYFGEKPAFNQRLINETATVAQWLSTHP